MGVKVIPLNTWPYSFDEPIRLRFISDGTYTVTVYLDNTTTQLAQFTVNPGTNDVDVAQASVLPDNNLHKLLVYVGTEQVATIPVKYGSTDPVSSIQFADEQGNLITLDFHILHLDYGIVRSGTGQAVSAYVGPRVVLEAYREYDDGTKHYFISSMGNFTAGTGYTIQLKRQAKHAFKVKYKIDFTSNVDIAIIGTLVRYASELAAILTEKGLELALEGPFHFAKYLANLFNINLPITDVQVERQGSVVYITVTHIQDINPVILYVALAYLAGISTILIIEFIFGGPVEVKMDAGQVLIEKNKLYQDMVNTCKQLSQGQPPDYYIRCLQASAEFIGKANTTETELLKNVFKYASEARSEADNWKAYAALIIIGAILVAIAK